MLLDSFKSAIAISWRRNGAYAQRLLEDVPADQTCAQPVPGRTLNHAAWIFSHLTLYAGIAGIVLRGDELIDPIDHEFGPKSRPLPDLAAYASRESLLAKYLETHVSTEQALMAVTAERLSEPSPLPRWQAMHPCIADLVLMMMIKHESGHLGQLSAWRRAMGLPPVAM